VRLIALLTLLVACPTPGGFARRFADADCAWMWKCDRDAYDLLEGDGQLCEEVVADAVNAATACLEQHCEFDANEAAACLDGVEHATCDANPYASCAGVWTGCVAEEVCG
jgi:hypothetical protein